MGENRRRQKENPAPVAAGDGVELGSFDKSHAFDTTKRIIPLEAASGFLSIGAALHWLHPRQKRPIADGWSTAPKATRADLERQYIEGANIGIRLGEPSRTPAGYLHVLDLDIDRPEATDAAWAAARRLAPNLYQLPEVISGSGAGRHFYFFNPTPLRSAKLAKGEGWQIELLGTGKQGVLPPSIHPDTGQPYRWHRPINFDLVSQGIGPTVNIRQEATKTADTSEANWPRIRSALEAITDATDYSEWVQVGMALHSAAGGSAEAFGLWCDWAKQDPRYDQREHRNKWRSFKGQGTGLGTLFQIAKSHGWTPPEPVYEFDDLPALPETDRPKMKIMLAGNGDPRPNLNNAIVFLEKVNALKGYSIRKNEMTGQEEWRAGPINDADLGLIRVAIEQAGMHNVGAELTAGAVRAVAELNSYHPVKEWLAQLPPHDGKRRLDTWLTDYMGAETTPYSRAVGRAFLVAMVARVMRPGCKHDHVLVLGGSQGIGKSTACQILGGAWSGDNMPSIRDGAREAGLYLRGHWLVELAELAPSRKAEAEDLKAFLSRSTDEIRAPYARRADVVPRQCVFIGTTNETAFLKDASGGRRFWPVTCGAKIDTDGLAADREQLFAEALAAFYAGETWHLTPEMERQAGIEQESAREEHPWEQPIRRILDGLTNGDGFDLERKDRVTVSEVLTLLGIPTGQQTSGNSRQVGGILRLVGWKCSHTKAGNFWERQ
ncbi:VapE domain-containing protein [Tabrizicola sp.]|uniref:VapE domain-containing protein n=1 Tax=Tabrizicola sp. TaxID=2005166 RepID=UPI002735A7F9|nr:VapE domain-containing protein [Tabrizicola sp.]